jgi:hypothetical protein
MKQDILDEISRYLTLDKNILLEKSVESFLKEKRRAMLLERLQVLSRYQTSSAKELEEKIRKGLVSEHPAWEDVIVVENLDAALEKLDGYLRNL